MSIKQQSFADGMEHRLRKSGKPDAQVAYVGGGWFTVRYGFKPASKMRRAGLKSIVELNEGYAKLSNKPSNDLPEWAGHEETDRLYTDDK